MPAPGLAYGAQVGSMLSQQAAQTQKSQQESLKALAELQNIYSQIQQRKAPQMFQDQMGNWWAVDMQTMQPRMIIPARPPGQPTPPQIRSFDVPGVEGGKEIEITEPSGKIEYRFERVPKELNLGQDFNRAWKQLYPDVKSISDLTQEQFTKINDLATKFKSAPGEARAKAFGNIRVNPVLDTWNGNAPMFLSSNDITKFNQEQPGRFIPAGVGVTALNKLTLLEDIRGSIGQVRESLNALDQDFSFSMKARIAIALRHRDPQSAISTLVNSEAGRELTPAQQDYLIAITQLQEQAMAMRSVLGAGQGSEDLRAAILATIPSATTPTKEYGLKQLVLFENTLNRLARGIPKVRLGPMPSGGGLPVGPGRIEDTKTIGGKTYVKIGEKWFEQ